MIDGCHLSAWLFSAAGVLHELPGRVQVGSGAGAGVGSVNETVRPLKTIASAPQVFVSFKLTPVTVLVPSRPIVSMSMTPAEPSIAVPLQTFAFAPRATGASCA